MFRAPRRETRVESEANGFDTIDANQNSTPGLAIQIVCPYHTYMASKTTINFDDEMEAALAELMELDGTKTLAIKRSLLAEVQRRRRREAMLGLIAAWEDEQGPIDQKHLDWADRVLDRQGVDG